CPLDAPAWVGNAFAQISGKDIGEHYEEVLDAWLGLERKYGFTAGSSNSSFSRVARPQEVTDWIRDGRGRSVGIRAIANLEAFEKTWWAWWTALQPAWRKPAQGQLSPPAAPGMMDWGKLIVPGQNGLLSVVAALYWWGVAEKEAGRSARSSGWD
ncbi:hypothetical protein C8F04DRAFT_907552, partial [Mycena alexandri]